MTKECDLRSNTIKGSALVQSIKNIPIVNHSDSVSDIICNLKNNNYESINHLVVCENEKYLGLVTIEKLLAESTDIQVANLIETDYPVVNNHTDQEKAAWQAIRKSKTAIPVIDEQGNFNGLITAKQLLNIMVTEHEEDLSRLSGLMKSTFQAKESSEETVKRRFWHRLPWLLIGLLGALISADLVGWFEIELQGKIALAFFIPGIVYLADAVGTQSETIVIRALSVGIPAKKIIGREQMTGLLIGLILALITAPIVWWRWGDPSIALIVSLSLLTACTIAATIAVLLPWFFSKLSIDPAFGSGPLATVIQDLLSLLIYFYIAILILR